MTAIICDPPGYEIPDELPGDDDYWLTWWDTIAEQTDPNA